MPAPGHFVAYAEGLRRKLLRIWALLSNASEELRQVDLPAGAAERLERQLGAFTAELERSVSPAPGRELHGLFPPREASAATPREVRIEYAGLLGWAGSLVMGILSQVQAAAARAARPVLASGPRGQGCSPAAPGGPVAAIGADGPVPGPAGAPWPSGAYLLVRAGIRRPCSRLAGPGWFGDGAGPPEKERRVMAGRGWFRHEAVPASRCGIQRNR